MTKSTALTDLRYTGYTNQASRSSSWRPKPEGINNLPPSFGKAQRGKLPRVISSLCRKGYKAVKFCCTQLRGFNAGPVSIDNHLSCTHTDPLFPVINTDFIFLPVDGRLRVSTRWLALQYGRLSSCHHNISRVLAEVIP